MGPDMPKNLSDSWKKVGLMSVKKIWLKAVDYAVQAGVMLAAGCPTSSCCAIIKEKIDAVNAVVCC